MNFSDLIKTDEESESGDDLEKISKEEDNSIKKLKKEYETRISGMSLYFLSEKEWCESQGIEYFSLFTSRKESATEISRNYAIEILSKLDKYKIFYEEN